jgi:hypothetical protein
MPVNNEHYILPLHQKLIYDYLSTHKKLRIN